MTSPLRSSDPEAIVPLDSRFLRGSQSDEPLTAESFERVMRAHARETMPRSAAAGSYEQTARRVGRVTHVLAFLWVLLDAPGVPPVERFIDTKLEGWIPLFVAGGAAIFVLYGMAEKWWWLPQPIDRALRFPCELLTDTYCALVLLTGVAVIGCAALIPPTVVSHLLGLTS